MTEQEKFEGIARKDNATFLFLYQENKEKILRMVQKNNGNEEDALDIFQEGMIALWTNTSQGKFQLKENARISTYLFALCRNLWISKLRKRKQIYSLEHHPEANVEEESGAMAAHHEKINELERQFGKLNESCRKILTLFYYQKTPLKEIASQMGITEKTAKNNKYRCMQSLRAQYQSER